MRRISTIVLIACLVICSACQVGPKYKLPAVPQTPAGFKELTENDHWKFAKPNDGELRGNWWEMFNDAKLTELEGMVSVSNQSLKQAEAQFRQARALVRVNRADYFPTISTSPGISVNGAGSARGRGTVTGPSGTISAAGSSGINSSFSIPVGASWEPDIWGRVGLAVQNAVANAQASAADLENVRLLLQAELATDYFQLRGIDMNTDLLTNTLDAYRRALELTRNRYNGGVASKSDVVLAQTQYDSTKAQLTDLGVARAQFEHAIALLAGHAPSDITVPRDVIQGTPPPIPVSLPSQLLERRPDIASNERRVAAANANIGLARAAFYPSLSISASAGLDSSNISSLFTWPARFWSVGPQLAQTLFDFGRRSATVEEFQANYDSVVAGYRQTALTAFQEVEDALVALRVLAQEAEEQASAVRGAEESLALELDRYKGGTVGYLDVIQTQVIALNNERASVDILQRRMTAAVSLIRALGGGWSQTTLPSPSDLKAKPAKTARSIDPGNP